MQNKTVKEADMPPPYCPLCQGSVVSEVKEDILLTKCKSCGLLQTDEVPPVTKVKE